MHARTLCSRSAVARTKALIRVLRKCSTDTRNAGADMISRVIRLGDARFAVPRVLRVHARDHRLSQWKAGSGTRALFVSGAQHILERWLRHSNADLIAASWIPVSFLWMQTARLLSICTPDGPDTSTMTCFTIMWCFRDVKLFSPSQVANCRRLQSGGLH